jgi:MFS family permease
MEIAQKGRWAVTTLFFVNGLVTGAWAVQIAQLVSRFHITDKVIGHLILIFGLGALFMMPLSGMAMEKYGSQRIVRIFSIAASPALIPVGLAPDIYLLTPILFFLGAMIGAMNVAMNSNAVAVEKALSRTVLSSCHCFWSIGLFTSGLIGGYLVKQFGFLTHLFLIGTFSLAITLSVCPHVIKDKSIRIKRSIKEKQPHHSSTIYVIGVIALLAMIPECAVVDWSSRYLLKNLNATTETASLAFACFAGTMAIFRFLGDFIRNRFDAIFVMRTSSLVLESDCWQRQRQIPLGRLPLVSLLLVSVSPIWYRLLFPRPETSLISQPMQEWVSLPPLVIWARCWHLLLLVWSLN